MNALKGVSRFLSGLLLQAPGFELAFRAMACLLAIVSVGGVSFVTPPMGMRQASKSAMERFATNRAEARRGTVSARPPPRVS
jgi:UPF0716 family protein affecting phage T7 exclusion